MIVRSVVVVVDVRRKQRSLVLGREKLTIPMAEVEAAGED